MPQLDISTYTPQVFWMVITFSIMFGMFLGKFLPKLSNIFQKRFDATKQADSYIQALSQSSLQLQMKYDEEKEIAIRETQNYIDQSLAAIRETHENRLQSLEMEMQQELRYLQNNYKQQHDNFNDAYRDIINEAAAEVLNKLGIKNEH